MWPISPMKTKVVLDSIGYYSSHEALRFANTNNLFTPEMVDKRAHHSLTGVDPFMHR